MNANLRNIPRQGAARSASSAEEAAAKGRMDEAVARGTAQAAGGGSARQRWSEALNPRCVAEPMTSSPSVPTGCTAAPCTCRGWGEAAE